MTEVQLPTGYPVADPDPIDPERRRAAAPGGLLTGGQSSPEAYFQIAGDYAGWYPSQADALAMIDGYGWHPLHEDAVDAILDVYDKYGPLEAMARATELAELFEAMCGPSPWGWLG